MRCHATCRIFVPLSMNNIRSISLESGIILKIRLSASNFSEADKSEPDLATSDDSIEDNSFREKIMTTPLQRASDS